MLVQGIAKKETLTCAFNHETHMDTVKWVTITSKERNKHHQACNLIPLPTMRKSNPNDDILCNIPVLKNKVFRSPVFVRKYNTNALILKCRQSWLCTPLYCCHRSTNNTNKNKSNQAYPCSKNSIQTTASIYLPGAAFEVGLKIAAVPEGNSWNGKRGGPFKIASLEPRT